MKGGRCSFPLKIFFRNWILSSTESPLSSENAVRFLSVLFYRSRVSDSLCLEMLFSGT